MYLPVVYGKLLYALIGINIHLVEESFDVKSFLKVGRHVFLNGSTNTTTVIGMSLSQILDNSFLNSLFQIINSKPTTLI